MFVSFNMRFRAVAATTKNEWGNCHKQWARKVAAQKAIIMKLLGHFLLLLAVLHSPYPTCFLDSVPSYHFSVFGSRFSGSSTQVHLFLLFLQLLGENLWPAEYILVYRHIYRFQVGSVLRQFYSILFSFEWKVHKKNQEEVSRSFLRSLCE